MAQNAPSPVGLTPGAPLGSDQQSDEGIVVGDTAPGMAGDIGYADPTLTSVAPVGAEPVMAAPVIGEPVTVGAAPLAPAAGVPVIFDDPNIPSSAGLTPGAPLGSDSMTDQKIVAGQEWRAETPGMFFR